MRLPGHREVARHSLVTGELLGQRGQPVRAGQVVVAQHADGPSSLLQAGTGEVVGAVDDDRQARVGRISMVVLAAIVAVVAWPGAFPVWLRVEQAVCGASMLSVVVRTNLRVVRSSMAAGPGVPKITSVARQ